MKIEDVYRYTSCRPDHTYGTSWTCKDVLIQSRFCLSLSSDCNCLPIREKDVNILYAFMVGGAMEIWSCLNE